MKARIHTPRIMERLLHPLAPRDAYEVVSALVWDGDKVAAYWLTEEMVMHPRVRALAFVAHASTRETHGYWLGTWSVLGDCLTEKQRKSKPETTLDRERAEDERKLRERRAV